MVLDKEILNNKSGIYSLIINDKIYIGSTNNFYKRLNSHFKNLNKNQHHNKYLQYTYNKYKEINYCIIEYVENLELLIVREQFWINFFKSYNSKFGFNFSRCADNAFRGKKHTLETKMIISKTNTGRTWDEERKIKFSQFRTGKGHSQETKEKLAKLALTIHNMEKKYIKMVSPEGKLVIRFGIRDFCREFNLTRANIMKVIEGKIRHSKGWRKYVDENSLKPYVKEKRTALNPEARLIKFRETMQKKSHHPKKKWEYFCTISPNGVIYKVYNANKLSKEIGLKASDFSRMLSGLLKHVKGWRLCSPLNSSFINIIIK